MSVAAAERTPGYLEFASRREGMLHAMDGGLWLHRHVWKGEKMAHLVVDRALNGHPALCWPRWEEMLGIGPASGFTGAPGLP